MKKQPTLREAVPMSADLKLSHELMSFKHLWKGGYFEGDPLIPLGRSSYGQLNYMSVLHATYLRCIKPYIDSRSVVLEIGPGKGAWTKCMLSAREVWALDALPETHNGFYQYLGNPENVKYFQVSDFECSMLPEDILVICFHLGVCVTFHLPEFLRMLEIYIQNCKMEQSAFGLLPITAS
jgi:hypothetical protein